MKLLEVSVAAQKLSVSESTIRRMIKDPKSPLRGVRVAGRVLTVADSVDSCIRPVLKVGTLEERV